MTAPEPPDLWPTVCSLAIDEPWPPGAEGALRLVDACRRHELLPLLACSPDLPRTVRDALASHAALLRLYEERARLFAQARARLEAMLAGERLLFLKGADYGHRLYRDPGLRPMKDIDVLVPSERCDPVCRSLESAGLQRVYPGTASTRAASYHERAFALGGLQVEIHAAFIQTARHRVDYGGVWRRAVIDPATGFGRLEDVDALAYHALAMAADQFKVRLIRYVDLWLLLASAPGALDRVAERAREWSSVRALYGALRMLGWLFPQWDGTGIAAVRQDLLPAGARRFVDRWILPRPTERARRRLPSRLVQVWRKLGLLDDWSRRGSFVASHLAAGIEGRRALRRERSGP